MKFVKQWRQSMLSPTPFWSHIPNESSGRFKKRPCLLPSFYKVCTEWWIELFEMLFSNSICFHVTGEKTHRCLQRAQAIEPQINYPIWVLLSHETNCWQLAEAPWMAVQCSFSHTEADLWNLHNVLKEVSHVEFRTAIPEWLVLWDNDILREWLCVGRWNADEPGWLFWSVWQLTAVCGCSSHVSLDFK